MKLNEGVLMKLNEGGLRQKSKIGNNIIMACMDEEDKGVNRCPKQRHQNLSYTPLFFIVKNVFFFWTFIYPLSSDELEHDDGGFQEA